MSKYITLRTITHLSARIEIGQVIELNDDEAAAWGPSYISAIVENENDMNEEPNVQTDENLVEPATGEATTEPVVATEPADTTPTEVETTTESTSEVTPEAPATGEATTEA